VTVRLNTNYTTILQFIEAFRKKSLKIATQGFSKRRKKKQPYGFVKSQSLSTIQDIAYKDPIIFHPVH
jgi:hypothetical protein